MYIKVKVTPKAKKELFEKVAPDSFMASVREPAERNLANKAVASLVARHFKVVPAKARLVSGHRSRTKIFSIEV